MSLFPRLAGLLALAVLPAVAAPAFAQQLLPPAVAGRAYEYLMLTQVQSPTRNTAKLLLAPAFNGRTEIALEALNSFLTTSRLEEMRRNDEVLAQTLGELSAAGWELVQVTPGLLQTDRELALTRYLLRRPRP